MLPLHMQAEGMSMHPLTGYSPILTGDNNLWTSVIILGAKRWDVIQQVTINLTPDMMIIYPSH